MILVTGGTGLVGSYLLLELCKQNSQVIATTKEIFNTKITENLFIREKSEALFKNIKWIESDLLDVTSIEPIFEHNIEVVYHAAGFISFKEKDRKQLLDTNIQITKNIINFSIESKVHSFFHFSSIATINDKKEEQEYSEKSSWNFQIPHSSYALSKKLSETEVWRGNQEGLNIIIFNPGIIIGSLDGKRKSEDLFKLSERKICFSPTGSTGFIDVRDVVKIATYKFNDKDFNTSYILVAENLSYKNMFNILRNQIGLNSVKTVSPAIIKMVRIISKITSVFGYNFLSKSGAMSLNQKSKYNNDKITNLLDYKWIPMDESLNYHQKHYLECKNL